MAAMLDGRGAAISNVYSPFSFSSQATAPFHASSNNLSFYTFENGEEETKRMRVGKGCRIGFRTRSQVEILDDGFKWRKYGKKSVKNSPNPRNYYRCSMEGCGVKKRVERDREDPCYVITIYEGVHNHLSPSIVHPNYSNQQSTQCNLVHSVFPIANDQFLGYEHDTVPGGFEFGLIG